MKEKKKGNEKWKERKDYLGASNLREEKEKRKRETRVCNLRVLTFDRYPSKKGELLFLQWVLRNRCLEIMLAGNTNVAKRADDEFDSRIFFKESNHAFRDARVLRIFEGWRNFGNFFFFPLFRYEENY